MLQFLYVLAVGLWTGSVLVFAVPTGVVLCILAVIVLCCRTYLLVKRREDAGKAYDRQVHQVRQRAARAAINTTATAKVVAVQRVECPEGIVGRTTFAATRPGYQPTSYSRSVLIRSPVPPTSPPPPTAPPSTYGVAEPPPPVMDLQPPPYTQNPGNHRDSYVAYNERTPLLS